MSTLCNNQSSKHLNHKRFSSAICAMCIVLPIIGLAPTLRHSLVSCYNKRLQNTDWILLAWIFGVFVCCRFVETLEWMSKFWLKNNEQWTYACCHTITHTSVICVRRCVCIFHSLTLSLLSPVACHHLVDSKHEGWRQWLMHATNEHTNTHRQKDHPFSILSDCKYHECNNVLIHSWWWNTHISSA